MRVLLVAIACLSLSSCAGVVEGEIRSPLTGVVYDEEGAHVDATTVSSIVGKITRLMSGEDFEDVILDPFGK